MTFEKNHEVGMGLIYIVTLLLQNKQLLLYNFSITL